jgi:hypothetical protein
LGRCQGLPASRLVPRPAVSLLVFGSHQRQLCCPLAEQRCRSNRDDIRSREQHRYVAYIVAEIPNTLMMPRFGARVWIPRIDHVRNSVDRNEFVTGPYGL